MATAVPTVAACVSPAWIVSCVAAPAMAVAVNVTGVAVPAVAVSVLAPADVPSVQDVIVAIPLASVMTAVGLTVPLPDATAKRTGTPAVGLSNWSRTSTAGGVATAVPTVAACVAPAWIVSCVATSAVAVAVNVTGLPVPREAVSVLLPAVVPSVQAVVAAIPLASVDTAVTGLTVPPPDVTANVTATPATGLLNWSRMSTAGGVAIAVPTVAACVSPAWIVSCVAAPAVPVAVKVTGVPVPAAVAVSVLLPAVVPSVHDVIVAIPLASVMTAVAGLTVPLPDATAKRTGTPAVGLSNWSRTSTAGGVATAVPTVAACVAPAWIVSCVAAPAVPVAVNVTG